MKRAVVVLGILFTAFASGCWRPYYGQTYAPPAYQQPQVYQSAPVYQQPAPVYQQPVMQAAPMQQNCVPCPQTCTPCY